MKNFRKVFQSELERNVPSSLELSEFLIAAYDWNQRQCAEGWRTPLWEFCRVAKGHPALIGLTAAQALAVVEQWLKTLKRPAETGAWQHFFPDVGINEDARMEFISVWQNVRYIRGYTPLDNAIEKAKLTQLRPRNCPTAGYRFFVSLAYWLQRTMGSRSILLPCHLIAEKLGLAAMTISRYRRLALKHGLLKIVETHRYSSEGSGEATQFRFNLTRFEKVENDGSDLENVYERD